MRQTKELYGFILSSKLRHGILKALAKKSPRMQADIAKTLKRKQQDISNSIYQLEKEKLIECLTPEKSSYKLYVITKLGKEMLEYKYEG